VSRTGRHGRLVELVTDRLNFWRDSNQGDREGATDLLVCLFSSHEFVQFAPHFGEATDYMSARLRELR
jgi:hypothetical protein